MAQKFIIGDRFILVTIVNFRKFGCTVPLKKMLKIEKVFRKNFEFLWKKQKLMRQTMEKKFWTESSRIFRNWNKPREIVAKYQKEQNLADGFIKVI